MTIFLMAPKPDHRGYLANTGQIQALRQAVAASACAASRHQDALDKQIAAAQAAKIHWGLGGIALGALLALVSPARIVCWTKQPTSLPKKRWRNHPNFAIDRQ